MEPGSGWLPNPRSELQLPRRAHPPAAQIPFSLCLHPLSPSYIVTDLTPRAINTAGPPEMARGESWVIRIWPIFLFSFLLKDAKGVSSKPQEFGRAFGKRRAGEGGRGGAAPSIQVCHLRYLLLPLPAAGTPRKQRLPSISPFICPPRHLRWPPGAAFGRISRPGTQ